ncbi:MAG: hypothetical protein JSS86_00180 [Cyanobacteria bacterium SZAS LIN-2]|nr:hypothetical protein [Cyanobacteria bacterium SZAS LIN-2]
MLSKDSERLIGEHIATIMAFACSRSRLTALVSSISAIDWSYLRPVCFETAERQADRALLELSLYLRIADDSANRFLSTYESEQGTSFGELVGRDGSRKPLAFRDVPNKIIHATGYRWEELEDNGRPIVTCLAGKPQDSRDNWAQASIDLVSVFNTGSFLWLL